MDSMGGALGPVLAWGLGDLAFLVCWVSLLAGAGGALSGGSGLFLWEVHTKTTTLPLG